MSALNDAMKKRIESTFIEFHRRSLYFEEQVLKQKTKGRYIKIPFDKRGTRIIHYDKSEKKFIGIEFIEKTKIYYCPL